MRHRTPWFEAQAVPADGRFTTITEMFWHEAQLAVKDAGPSMPDGRFEFEQGASRVEGLVLREQAFAALRIVRCAVEKHPKVFIFELFLAKPATHKPVVGIRAWRLDMTGEPVEGGLKQPTLWERVTSSVALAGPREGPALPYFHDVVRALEAPVSTDTQEAAQAAQTAAGATLSPDALRQVELDRDYYRELAESQAVQLNVAQQKLAHLRESFQRAATEDEVEAERQELRTLKALPVWALENQSRLVMLPRALAGARRSQYQSDEDIYRALDFLAGPYRDLRLNLIGTDAYQAAMQALQTDGFQLARSVDPSVAGEQGEAYFVRYGARRRFLDWHLLKGGGRDERFCLRIYFFWDDAERVAVVGSLPAHLGNSLS